MNSVLRWEVTARGIISCKWYCIVWLTRASEALSFTHFLLAWLGCWQRHHLISNAAVTVLDLSRPWRPRLSVQCCVCPLLVTSFPLKILKRYLYSIIYLSVRRNRVKHLTQPTSSCWSFWQASCLTRHCCSALSVPALIRRQHGAVAQVVGSAVRAGFKPWLRYL